jgi:two-component system LytT family response regulator
MELFKVMLVEDEIHILKYMKKKLEEYDIFSLCAEFSSPEEALSAFDGLQPDVAFLDIEMPRISGMELAAQFLKKKRDLCIIFTTAYGQYAVDAFEIEAVDYLMKPIVDEDILRVIKRLQKNWRRDTPAPPVMEQRALHRGYHECIPARCFGDFEVRDREQQLISWPTRKAEELFAYFLTRQEKYVGKWELIELFWPEGDEDKSLHNLYNTIYRMKQVLKKLPLEPAIKKVNEGYLLEGERALSDLTLFMSFMEQHKAVTEGCEKEAASLFFSYRTPLFGTRAYIWSISVQEYAARYYKRLCRQLLQYHKEKNQFQKADEILRYYVGQHIEDEEIMRTWLELLRNWKGHEGRMEEYRIWFNKELKKEDLPALI